METTPRTRGRRQQLADALVEISLRGGSLVRPIKCGDGWLEPAPGNEYESAAHPEVLPNPILLEVTELNQKHATQAIEKLWLPPRDSNPDMLIQSQLSYR